MSTTTDMMAFEETEEDEAPTYENLIPTICFPSEEHLCKLKTDGEKQVFRSLKQLNVGTQVLVLANYNIKKSALNNVFGKDLASKLDP